MLKRARDKIAGLSVRTGDTDRGSTEGRWVNLTKPLEGAPIRVTLREGDVIDAEIQGNELSDFYSILAVALWKGLRAKARRFWIFLTGRLIARSSKRR
jgi:hypothetical protein